MLAFDWYASGTWPDYFWFATKDSRESELFSLFFPPLSLFLLSRSLFALYRVVGQTCESATTEQLRFRFSPSVVSVCLSPVSLLLYLYMSLSLALSVSRRCCCCSSCFSRGEPGNASPSISRVMPRVLVPRCLCTVRSLVRPRKCLIAIRTDQLHAAW